VGATKRGLFAQKMIDQWRGDVVGDVGNDFVGVVWGSERECILMSNVDIALVFKNFFKFGNELIVKF